MLAKLLVASLDTWFGLTLARWTALAMVSGEAYAGGGGVLPPPLFAGGAAPTLPHAYDAAEAAAALPPLPLLFVGGAGGEVLVVDATPVVVIPAGAAGGSGEPQALPPGGTARPPFRPLDGAADDDGVDSGVRSVPIWFGLTWADGLCFALGRPFLFACLPWKARENGGTEIGRAKRRTEGRRRRRRQDEKLREAKTSRRHAYYADIYTGIKQ